MTHADDAERHIANRAADAAYAEIADSLAIALPPLRDATRSAWRYRSVFARWARVEFRTRQTRLAADGLRWRDRPAWLTGRAATAALCLTAAISADDLGARWGGPFTTFGVLAATAYLRLAGRQLPRERPWLPGARLLWRTIGRTWVCCLITTVTVQATLWPSGTMAP